MDARLVLDDGTIFHGTAFGYPTSAAGEVVFNTGMVGYPECLTDPSYAGEILTLTYPMIGNYGVPRSNASRLNRYFESERIQVAGLVVMQHCEEPSHRNSEQSLHQWLFDEHVPAIADVDTRALTQHLRSHGTMLGRLIHGEHITDTPYPDFAHLVEKASTPTRYELGVGSKRVAVVDCGCKNNILRMLIRRGIAVTVVPWDWPVDEESCDGVVLSNGPGDPTHCGKTIDSVRRLLEKEKPTFGICLGNQILALAAGAETYKLKFGHRGQNQPCVQVGAKRCFITSQNHGYAVDEDTLPAGWTPWFYNANDGTNEGVCHESKPFRGVQFHPEASPGPSDTEYLFDEFVSMI